VIDSPVVTWKDLYQVAASRLGDGPEARWLVEDAAGEPWSALMLSDSRASEKARSRLQAMIDRRLAGEPLQYVLGHWAFRGLDLMVDRRVLIPRPETEQLVEVALAELDRLASRGTPPRFSGAPNASAASEEPAPSQAAATRFATRSATRSRSATHPQLATTAQVRGTSEPAATVVDLGTGSGAIALSIVAERPGVRVWATDASDDALAVAGANLAGLAGFAATRVRLCGGYWWSALPADLQGRVDLVVSNPPYVATSEMATLDGEVLDWEPRPALEAGPTGLEAVEEILSSALLWLRLGGAAVLEIAPHQSAGAQRAALLAGFTHAEVRPDLAGRDRVLVARTAPTGLTVAPGGTRED
jgi:release factor glutamine methyltransferase